MKLSEQINEDLKAAMRAKDKVRLEALRALKTAFTLERTAEGSGGELSSDAELKIIQKLVKQRKEAATIYEEQSRDDLFRKEMSEAEVLEAYLPAKMSRNELESYLKGLMERTGSADMKDMGKMMGIASKELAGKADGKEIAEIVRGLLAS